MPNQTSKRALVVYREADRVIPYRDALVEAGIEPVLAEARAGVSLDGFDGLVLTGGTDVDPALYDEVRGEHTDPPDTERDRVEFILLQQALLSDVPVLAICRGMQLVNVFHGGTLHQHLEPVDRHRGVADGIRAEPIHTVAVEPDSWLRRIVGSPELAVNSRHHQAVARLGDNLRVTARSAADGVIEAIERPDKSFVVAVQWHPEDQVFRFPEQLSLFAEFGNACAAAGRSFKVETYR